jgi:pimeloyl-ACP methyl ester carboxylesterase
MSSKNIVLLHGWGASTAKLRPLGDDLETLGWQVLLPELPGFDASAPKIPWGVNEYADFVEGAITKRFGENRNYIVFGHSFGGRIATALAASPRSKMLKGIVLCSISGVSRPLGLKRGLFFMLAKFGKLFLLLPPLAQYWKKGLYKLVREHDYEKTEGVMKKIFVKVVNEDLKPEILKVRKPVLILWGRFDKITPLRDAKYIEKTINNSKLVMYDDSHRLPYNKHLLLAEEITKWYKSNF